MMATLADLLTPYLILSANMIPLSNSMAALFALTYGNELIYIYIYLVVPNIHHSIKRNIINIHAYSDSIKIMRYYDYYS